MSGTTKRVCRHPEGQTRSGGTLAAIRVVTLQISPYHLFIWSSGFAAASTRDWIWMGRCFLHYLQGMERTSNEDRSLIEYIR
jgi:hypothetical protein